MDIAQVYLDRSALDRRAPISLELDEDLLSDRFERMEDPCPRRRRRLEGGIALWIQRLLKIAEINRARQITLVVLNDEGDRAQIKAMLAEVLFEVLEALNICVKALNL